MLFKNNVLEPGQIIFKNNWQHHWISKIVELKKSSVLHPPYIHLSCCAECIKENPFHLPPFNALVDLAGHPWSCWYPWFPWPKRRPWPSGTFWSCWPQRSYCEFHLTRSNKQTKPCYVRCLGPPGLFRRTLSLLLSIRVTLELPE